MATAPMDKAEKLVEFSQSCKADKGNVQAEVATLKAIKLNLETKRTEMQADPDFAAEDIAVITNGLNWMHTQVKSIFGD